MANWDKFIAAVEAGYKLPNIEPIEGAFCAELDQGEAEVFGCCGISAALLSEGVRPLDLPTGDAEARLQTRRHFDLSDDQTQGFISGFDGDNLCHDKMKNIAWVEGHTLGRQMRLRYIGTEKEGDPT